MGSGVQVAASPALSRVKKMVGVRCETAKRGCVWRESGNGKTARHSSHPLISLFVRLSNKKQQNVVIPMGIKDHRTPS